MGKVVHFEIPADDVERAKGFYAGVFGWQLEDVPGMDYTMAITSPVDENQMPTEAGAINGGLMKRTPEAPAPVVAIAVSSVDEALEKLAGAGGTVVRPKTEIPGMGYYAYASDTEGNVIGIWESMG